MVDASYRGEPILRLKGVLTSVGPGVDVGESEPLVSVFWNRDPTTEPPTIVEQTSVSTALRFPSAFELRVFEPPTADHLLVTDDRVALGMLLIYADRNANGHFDPQSDAMIGGNVRKGLVYATEPIEAADSPTMTALPLGFSLIDLPLGGCGGGPPHQGGGHGRPVQHCSAEDICPEGLTCDGEFGVCVPTDRFEVMIGGDFDVRRPVCRY